MKQVRKFRIKKEWLIDLLMITILATAMVLLAIII
jgi:hypothetical protein